MTLFQHVKSAITVPQAAAFYGMQVRHNGMTRCPFHEDRTPSMKLNDTYYYCFGCGAHGDVIDLTAKLFGLNVRQAAEKLAGDFGLSPDHPPAAPIALPRPVGLTDAQREDIAYCQHVLLDLRQLLITQEQENRPTSPEASPEQPLGEASGLLGYVDHLIDCLTYGDPKKRAEAAERLLGDQVLPMLETRIHAQKKEDIHEQHAA